MAATEESASCSIAKAISAQIIARSRAQGYPYYWDQLHQALATKAAMPDEPLWSWFS